MLKILVLSKLPVININWISGTSILDIRNKYIRKDVLNIVAVILSSG